MSFKAKVVKVMIATPSDVANERRIIRDTVYEWNSVHSEDKDLVLMPVGWELHATPTMGDRPQAIINKQVLKDCDLLIAAFWTRLGSPTGKAASGTVEEIDEHLKADKPAMIYFSSVPVVLESVDQKQYEALRKFKDDCRQKGLIAEYTSPEDFKDKLSRQLAQTVLRHFAKKNGRPSENDLAVPSRPKIPKLSVHAQRLLQEAAKDASGIIFRIESDMGLHLQTNGIDFIESRDARTQAKWDAALSELRGCQLIQQRDHTGEAFTVTNEGYGTADLLPANLVPLPA